MPGTEAPFQKWLGELDEAGITAIVCLNPEDEINLLSPEYRDWRRAQATTPAPERPALKLFDLPIHDGCAPTAALVEKFWTTAQNVADRCRAGERTLIHCTAGRGRTGMFGVAVLMSLGYSLVDAATEMYEVGSYPETSVQDELLEKGFSSG